MNSKVLCVDDDANILAGYQRNLRKTVAIDIAQGGEQGLLAMENQGPYAVVVADMQMPGMNGIQFLARVQEKWPDTVRVMLTGNADQKTAVEAVNQGHVYRFLNKPCSHETLALALDAGLKQFRLITAERELLENTLNGSIKVMTEILSAVDPPSFGRGQLLQRHMREFLASMGVRPSWEYEAAAMLSQIGCVTIPPEVIKKARSNVGLTGVEKDLLTRIPETGSTLLAGIPRLEGVAQIISYQNKNFDGSGFPLSPVAGTDIPLGSRILKVLSDLDQLEVRGMSRGNALVEMREQTGKYDPRVLDAAFKCFDVYLPNTSCLESNVHYVKIPELRVGQLLVSNVETSDGILLLAAGHRLTPVIMEKIRNFAKLNKVKEPIEVELSSP